MADEEHANYGLIVSFPDQSASFVHGYEAGVLWQRMQGGLEAEIAQTTHAENREVVSRMAVAAGWSLTVTPSAVEGWDETELRKVQASPPRPNPHGLRLIAQKEAPDV